MHRTLIFTLLGLLSAVLGYAQQPFYSGTLIFDRSVHDFGVTATNAGLMTDFTVTNTGYADAYLLNADFGEDTRVRYSATVIPPGESAVVRIKVTPSRKGKWERQIGINTGASPKPVMLTLRGQIKALDPREDPSCPNFQESPEEKRAANDFTVQVIDKATNLPIPGAAVRFEPNPFFMPLKITDRAGTTRNNVPVGLYVLRADAKGYFGDIQELYIGGGVTSTVLILDKIPVPQPILAETEPEQNTPEPEPQPKPRPEPTPTPQPKPIDTVVFVEKAGELSAREYGQNNIVFLIDVSSSMATAEKLPMLKESMKTLLSGLRSIDRVSIVTYASTTQVVLPSTPADDKARIASIIDGLKAAGSTEGGKGIREAYRVAHENFIPGGNNVVFLATDGDFNLDKSDDALFRYISRETRSGIYLSVLGFGRNRIAMEKMQKIANKGAGSYLHIRANMDYQAVLLEEVKLRSRK